MKKYYALKLEDDYLWFKWNELLQLETIVKSKDVNSDNLNEVIFYEKIYAERRLHNLIKDLKEYGNVGIISLSDEDRLKIVGLELEIKAKEAEQ